MATQQELALREIKHRQESGAWRYVEPAMVMGSSIIAEPVAGLGGLLSMAAGASPSEAGQAVRNFQEAMTYQPRTQSGQAAMRSVGETMAPIGEYMAKVSEVPGDYVYEKTGSPALAAAAYSAPVAALEMLGFKGARKAGMLDKGQSLEAGDIGGQASQFGGKQRGAIAPINQLESMRKAQAQLKADFERDMVDIRAQYQADPSRKAEIMQLMRERRGALDEIGSRITQAEMKLAPKPVQSLAPEKPVEPFKGKVYHQTSADFDDFDFSKSADGTIWFTQDKANFSDPASSASAASGKGRIIESDVELKKPAGWDEMDRYTIDELVQQGYDGAVLDGDIQVFEPSAIKAAPKPYQEFQLESGGNPYRIHESGKLERYNPNRESWMDLTGGAGEANVLKKRADIDAAGGLSAYEAESAGRAARLRESIDREKSAQQETYKMQHQAPMRSDYGDISDLSNVMPDLMRGDAERLLSYGRAYDKRAIAILKSAQGNPNKKITVYRAVPEGVNDINPSDWVTTTKDYALDHIGDDKGYKVISKQVRAKDLANEGDIHEFGYDPQ